MTAEDRYWAKVNVAGPDDCWAWTAATVHGYGWFAARPGRPENAHRFGWRLHFGEIPDGLCVLHHCDNPPCQNPSHWFLGTRAANNADKVAKGRQRTGVPKGSALPATRTLTDEQVVELRSRFTGAKGEGRRLAAEFGISPAQVSRIRNRRRRHYG